MAAEAQATPRRRSRCAGPWFNPAQRSAIFIVPGIIGVLLAITLTLITSTAIVRERERGTLAQLVITPIGKTSLMHGKRVPFMLPNILLSG